MKKRYNPQWSRITTACAFTCLLASTSIYASVDPDGPGHQISHGRDWITLNGTWKFKTDTNSTGFSQGYQTATFDESDWGTISVPGSWNLYDDTDSYVGDAWYRREFQKPSYQNGERVYLNFEAAYYKTEVWLNGELLGEHSGGYTPFGFDITDNLAPTNVISVRSNNEYSIGAWYYWGGLTRDVSLTVEPDVRIERQKIEAIPNLSTGEAVVTTEIFVSNSSTVSKNVAVSAVITDLEITPESEISLSPINNDTSLIIAAGETSSITFEALLTAEQYELWHFDSPVLYRSQVSINGKSYEVSDRFGVRLVEFDGYKLLLNGENVRLNGYNRISDDRAHGSMEPLHVVRRDMDRMIASGAQMSRIMHHAQAPELLDYADEKGMLLIAEVPVWGKGVDLSAREGSQYFQDAEEMIQRDWNHTSIFAWSVANEIKSTTTEGNEFVDAIYHFIKDDLDSTRPITFSSNRSMTSNDALKHVDFGSRNTYGGFGGPSSNFHQSYGSKPLYISEYSPDGYVFGTARERLSHDTTSASVLHKYERQPWVIGTAIWSYNDYRSTFSGTSYNNIRGWGIQNAWGQLKEGYKTMQEAHSPFEYFEVAPATNGTKVFFKAKTLQELPAYTLRDHQLSVQGLDVNGNVIGGVLVDLENIVPDGAEYKKLIEWNKDGLEIAQERVSLVSPTGYELHVEVNDIKPPVAPAITEIITTHDTLRVVFERTPLAKSYTLSVDGLQSSTSTILENFIEFSGLAQNQTYQLVLSASNHAGTNSVSSNATTSNVAASMAPILHTVIPFQYAAMVGFIVNEDEIEWEHEVRNAETGDLITQYTSSTIGATRIENLVPGTHYKVRSRGINSDNKSSIWSQYQYFETVEQNGEVALPKVKGVITGENSIAVAIEPTAQAEYYNIKYTSNGVEKIAKILVSATEILVLDGLEPNTSYEVSIQVKTASALSEFSTLTNVTTSAPFVSDTSDNRIILTADNSDSETIITGDWTASTFSNARIGSNYLHDSNSDKGSKSVEYFLPVTEPGNYQAYAYWNSSSSRADEVGIEVKHANGTDSVYVDQTKDGGQWVLLGTFEFDSSNSSIIIKNANTDNIVIADAVRLVSTFDGPSDAPSKHEIILDNNDAATVISGTWHESTYEPVHIGADYLHDANTNKGANSIEYSTKLTEEGSYRVYMHWSGTENRATNVPVTIEHHYGTATILVDQSVNAGMWVELGVFKFNTTDDLKVTISNTGTDGIVVADAIKVQSTFISGDSNLHSHIADSDNDSETTVITGDWSTSTYHSDRIGANYLHDRNAGKGTKTVEYHVTVPETGAYSVLVYWHDSRNRATDVPINVKHEHGLATEYVNQSVNGGQWNEIGVYQFDESTSAVITIRNEDTDDFVIADGIQLRSNF